MGKRISVVLRFSVPPESGATVAATTNPLARRCGRLERFATLPSTMTTPTGRSTPDKLYLHRQRT